MNFLANLTHKIAIPICVLGSISLQSAENLRISGSSEWPTYRGNTSGTGYSPLEQITLDNVDKLEVAWSYSLRNGSSQSAREPNSQATPVVINGVMFLPTVDSVVALDPLTGEELWSHSVSENAPSRRGVTYWPGEGGIHDT